MFCNCRIVIIIAIGDKDLVEGPKQIAECINFEDLYAQKRPIICTAVCQLLPLLPTDQIRPTNYFSSYHLECYSHLFIYLLFYYVIVYDVQIQ